ncbi:hypothetical protein HQ560_13890 [bacterium]|nr:hypothetical protein [bacterium]
MDAQSGRRTCFLAATAAVLTLAVIVAVMWGAFRLGADDWEWPRTPAPEWWRAGGPLCMLALLGLVAFVAWRSVEKAGAFRQVVILATLVSLGWLIQFSMLRVPPAGFHEGVIAIAKPGANRYHQAARGIDRLAPVLANYHQWMREDSHALVITNPAGPLTVFWCLNQVFAGDEARAAAFVDDCENACTEGVHLDESAWAAVLFQNLSHAELAGVWLAVFILPAFACLVAIPAYLLARSLYGRREGVLAAAFSLTVPSLLLFSPGMDQCYAVLAVTAAWLAHGAGRRRSLTMAACAGLVISVGMFFSLAFAVAALLAGLFGLVGLVQADGRTSVKRVATLSAAAGAAFLAPVALLYLGFGYRSFAVWRGCLEANASFNAATQRGYATWLLLNPVEFVAFLGVPVACLLAWRVFGKDNLPALAVVGLLVLLNGLGLNRGEVARLWLFLMPACVAVGVAEIERAVPYRRFVFVALFALQAVQAVVFRAVLKVLNII